MQHDAIGPLFRKRSTRISRFSEGGYNDERSFARIARPTKSEAPATPVYAAPIDHPSAWNGGRLRARRRPPATPAALVSPEAAAEPSTEPLPKSSERRTQRRPQLVHQHRSGVRAKDRQHCCALPIAPENAAVLSVDEKPHIQALNAPKPGCGCRTARRLPASITSTNGTARRPCLRLWRWPPVWSRLVITGAAGASSSCNFMNRLLAEYPRREIHIIWDNLNAHQPEHDHWLARHNNVHFHFTPTHASWLNEVEVRSSILASRALAGASFTSRVRRAIQIDAFIVVYNYHAHPFDGPSSKFVAAAVPGCFPFIADKQAPRGQIEDQMPAIHISGRRRLQQNTRDLRTLI